MGAGRTVSKRSAEELVKEYNALFMDKTVQKVLRYLAVREELEKRYGKLEVRRLSASQWRKDKNTKRTGLQLFS